MQPVHRKGRQGPRPDADALPLRSLSHPQPGGRTPAAGLRPVPTQHPGPPSLGALASGRLPDVGASVVGRPARCRYSCSAGRRPWETSPPGPRGQGHHPPRPGPASRGCGVLWSLNITWEGIWRAPSPQRRGQGAPPPRPGLTRLFQPVHHLDPPHRCPPPLPEREMGPGREAAAWHRPATHNRNAAQSTSGSAERPMLAKRRRVTLAARASDGLPKTGVRPAKARRPQAAAGSPPLHKAGRDVASVNKETFVPFGNN